MKVVIQRCAMLGVLLCLAASACADRAAQRQEFLSARQAYEDGDLTAYLRLTDALKTYPLYPYLRYAYLREHLDTVPQRELREFIARYDDSPVGARLRDAWLYQLARAQRWDDYLALYRDSNDTSLRCYQLQGRLNLAATERERDALLAQVERIWLVGHPQPGACDAVFQRLNASTRMNSDLIWARIRLAMEEGETQLAGELSLRLSRSEQTWVRRWQKMYERPATQLDHPDYVVDSERAREIVAYGVRRLARNAAETAHTRWVQLKPRYRFSHEQIVAVERDIAIAAARQRSPYALAWLAAIKDGDTDEGVRQWRIRSAVLAGDWARVQHWTQDLPAAEQTEAWQYWRARALQQRNDKDGAQKLYLQLAKSRSYYGFLANDRLGQDYVLRSQPTPYTGTQLDQFAAQPALQRAYELYQLGLVNEARREWSYATRSMDASQLQLAAVLAQHWGWYERSIMTAAQSGQWDDLELRFPTPYREPVLDNARRQQLDPAWIYGVLRQESAFRPDARSSAGALGLMQLMPATADHTARLLDWSPRPKRELLTPEPNIQLGSAYLRYILDRFRGNQLLATAAYNAGPGRVRQWLPAVASAPADQWVEAIPFTETRKYVQSVLSYSVIFDWRLQQPVTPLQRRMGVDVPALTGLTESTR